MLLNKKAYWPGNREMSYRKQEEEETTEEEEAKSFLKHKSRKREKS